MAAAQPPTTVLRGTTVASSSEQAKDTSPPLELRTRNIIARTPLAGPSPASATPASATGSAGVLPFLHTTPQSTLHQVWTPTSPDFQLCHRRHSKHCFIGCGITSCFSVCPVGCAPQTPSHSGMSTPSVHGLPEFLLEGDYTGMQTPHVVGMNNPTTAFKENKQLRRHETPFDTRSAPYAIC